MGNAFDDQPSVFVVDDEEQISMMFAVILQMNSFNALPFIDPLAALDAAKANPPSYLLTDVLMPKMNGVDLAMAIRDVAPNCKIIIFSGHESSETLIKKASTLGHDFTLVRKPIHPRKMVELMRNL